MTLECNQYDRLTEALVDRAFRTALGCGFEAQFGTLEVFGLLVMSLVGLTMWIRTESILMPWTVFMLTGSVVLPLVTAPAVAAAMLVVAGVGAAAPLLLARRMEVRG